MSGRNDWETPPDVFAACSAYFGKFDVDVAASKSNAKCASYFTDAFRNDWPHLSKCWMNPPYSDQHGRPCVLDFLIKAYEQTSQGTMTACLLVNDTSTDWYRFAAANATTIIHFTGARIRFKIDGKPAGTPTFSNLLAVFRPKWPDEPEETRIVDADWRDWLPLKSKAKKRTPSVSE